MVQAKLPHKLSKRVIETKGKGGRSIVEEETFLEPPPEAPVIGNTVKVLATLEDALRQDPQVNLRIQAIRQSKFSLFSNISNCITRLIVACGSMDEILHWERVMGLHRTKYSQPFTLPVPPKIPRPLPLDPKRTQQTLDDPSTLTAAPHPLVPASSVSPESVKSHATQELSHSMTHARMPRLRHPSRLKSSQLTLEALQTHVIYFMTCMMDQIKQSRHHGDVTRKPSCRSQRHTNGHDPYDELESKEWAGFGLGYLMRVPELQDLAVRIIKAERKRAWKRKILQERENGRGNGSAVASDGLPRPMKQIRASSLKKDVKRLFERVISNLFHNGAIVIEEGRSRVWNHYEAQMAKSSQFWKRKTSETLSQDGETTLGIINESSSTPIAAEDELELSDVDEEEDAYVPVMPHLLREPVLLALKRATRNLVGRQARARGVSEKEILEWLKCVDARWDHVSTVTAALHQLEEENEVWEVSQGFWVSH